ncbi:WD40-like Beta Propeller Repeat [Geosmithia morbida]|uniref:Dipeptidyl-peptidase V n=1 Tax=Geosmithia morbida TaxID=1094350 RepID=A0A9P4YVF0_9HYPO|nr:WD40-like Beta Propeller Repeat [Geosmithia morbida]KAF4122441.1 WD40-like Beta Propeller Repeat [Geosmithia morbida]
MTIQASHFTPEVLLSAPRRSAGAPNSTGQLVLYTVSSYSFESHSKSSQIRVLRLSDGSSHLVSEDATVYEPVWIGENEIAFLKPADRGCTALMTQNVFESPESAYMIQFFAGSLSNLKVKQISPTKAFLCCSAPTTPSGDMYWPSAEPKAQSSAKIYSSLFVRHWDTWSTENKSSLWFGTLFKKDAKWVFDAPGLTNLLTGTGLESPVPPFGGTADFDISSTGIVFVAKDPELNPARFTKTDLYYIPIEEGALKKPVEPRIVTTEGLRGYSMSPSFSRDGTKVAFTRMKSDKYESDRPRLLLMPDINNLSRVDEYFKDDDSWGARPDWITWADDDSEIYVGAEKHGRVVLWSLPANAQTSKPPRPLFVDGSVVEAKTLGGSKGLLISSRSLVENSNYSILNTDDASITQVSSSSKNGKSLGLSQSQCSDIWYEGAAGYPNHALVMKPSHFDKSKKYPLALLIHGGPQSAWTDDWSTRWNPAIFAEQGYVAVCPNPTGSTGYGQDHVDAITGNWGGTPYQDIVKCFEYIEKELDYVDTERAVALGASYGGYMMNWIQGNDLGRKFKAIVCHDGVFSTQNQWATEELFFPEHDFGGTLWENREGYAKWDPSLRLDQWSTPQLVIHNELDYRLPISEGLAMFNVLQAREVPSKLLVFPDENHWVLKPENSLVWHKEVLGWINHYSGVAVDANLTKAVGKMTV